MGRSENDEAIVDVGLAPNYRNPPLVETSLGVVFAPIVGWNVQHFGLYHQRVRGRYQGFETANPIALGSVGNLNISIVGSSPKIRAFFFNGGRSRLAQVQDDIFFLNWQKMGNYAAYPRYEALKNAFKEEWADFSDFLRENGLNVPIITQQQVTYINVMERSAGADSIDIEDVFSSWRPVSGPISDSRRDVSFSVAHRLKDVDLTCTLQPALRITDNKPVYQFTLNSSMATTTNSGESMDTLMDQLHEQLIAAFEEYASDRAKAHWGKI